MSLRPAPLLLLLGLALAGCSREKPAAPAPPPPPPVPCDRDCLTQTLDRYLDGLLTHDPQRVRWRPEYTFSENGVRLEQGDALWRTATALGSYRLVAVDEPRGTVAALVSIREAGEPAMLALRITVQDRWVVAVDTLVQRDAAAARAFEKRGAPEWPALPETARGTREDLYRVANDYFSALERNEGTKDVPFTDDCVRVEDGVVVGGATPRPGERMPDVATATRPSPLWSCAVQLRSGLYYHLARLRDRRFLAADVERGLVLALAYVDERGGDTRRYRSAAGVAVEAGETRPVTRLVAQWFRIEGGRIRETIAVRQPVTYGLGGDAETPVDITRPR